MFRIFCDSQSFFSEKTHGYVTLVFVVGVKSKRISLTQNRESIVKLIKIKDEIDQPGTKPACHFKVTASTGRLYNAFNNFHEFSITSQCYFLYILIEFLSR